MPSSSRAQPGQRGGAPRASCPRLRLIDAGSAELSGEGGVVAAAGVGRARLTGRCIGLARVFAPELVGAVDDGGPTGDGRDRHSEVVIEVPVARAGDAALADA